MPTLTGNAAPAPLEIPDFHDIQHTPDGAVSLDVNIWWETGNLGTALLITRGPDDDTTYRGTLSVAARWVSNFVEFGQAGLDPVLNDLGLAVRIQPSSEQPGYTHYAFATLPTMDLIERANAHQYPANLGRRMQFEPYYGTIYTIEEYFTAMAEGRMLIPVVGDDPWVKFHDVGDHMIAGLAMSGELVEAMAKRSREILANPELLAQLRDSSDVDISFITTWDKGTFSRHFLGFLNEQPEELEIWSKMLDTDIETVRGYATRARDELRQIGGLSHPEVAPEPPRTVKRRGWLPRFLFR